MKKALFEERFYTVSDVCLELGEYKDSRDMIMVQLSRKNNLGNAIGWRPSSCFIST